MRSSSSRRDAGWYGIASMVCGVCALGLLFSSRIVIVGVFLIGSFFPRGMPPNWSSTFVEVVGLVLVAMAFTFPVPAIVFSVKGKRRLSPWSKPQDSLSLNVGMILGILCSVILGLVLIFLPLLIFNPPWHEKTGTTSSIGKWKNGNFTDSVSIKYREVKVDENASLRDIMMISPESGWVVGSGGAVFRYFDNEWRRMRGVPKGIDLDSVSAVDENDVWFAGTDVQPIEQGQEWLFKFWIFHYDGQKISEVGSWPVKQTIATTTTTLAMTAKNDGWAGCYSGLLLHYDGQKWNPAKNINEAVYCLVFENASKGWQLGKNLYTYANGQWKQEGPELDGVYNKILPMKDGSVLLAADHILKETIDDNSRHINALARVENGNIQNTAGFEQRFIYGMAEGQDSYAVLVGAGGKEPGHNVYKSSEDYNSIMLYQNGRKVGREIGLPWDLDPNNVSFDSPHHGWICTDSGNMIEFMLRISK